MTKKEIRRRSVKNHKLNTHNPFMHYTKEQRNIWSEYLKETYNLVKVFNVGMKVKIAEIPQESIADTRILYGTLIKEELKEYITADSKKEKLDGLVDLLYVAQGAMLACGLDISYAALTDPAHLSRGLTYFAPVAAGELVKDRPCWKRLSWSVPGAVYSTLITGLQHFPQFMDAFRFVHSKNMTKFWKEKPADPELVSEPAGDATLGFIVRRKLDGKVMKPPGFIHPDLSSFI